MTAFPFRLIAFMIVAGLTPVGAEGQSPAEPLDRLERVLDRETYQVVVQVIERARARALPVDPLVDRALEGAMKRAPAARIQTAVVSLAERLETARTMLAPAPTADDIAAGAGALAVGVPGETLRAIRSVQPGGPVAVPLGVLTELVVRRVPVDRAASLVVQLLRRGATSTQLVALSGDVQRDIAAGIDPGAAFDVRTRGVASVLGGEGGVADLEAGTAARGPVPLGSATDRGAGAPSPRTGSRRP